MLKRSVISVTAALAATGSVFAESQTTAATLTTNNAAPQMIEVSASDLQALKAQIQALTVKVNTLEAQQQKQAQQDVITEQGTKATDHTHTVTHENDNQTDTSSSEKSSKPQPLFRGQHFYIESDAEYNDTLLEQLSSSQLPLGTLMLKDRFANPSLVIGGSLEADVQGWWGDKVAYTNSNGQNQKYENGAGAFINTANVDFLTNINEWVQGYLTLAGTEDGIDIQNAFINFGNLNKFPFFASVGKNRPPLGTFGGGGVWASSIGTMLFRPTQVTNVTLGYSHEGLTTYLSGWRNTNTAHSTTNEYDFIYSAFYTENITKKLAYSVNAGYMNNLIGSGAGSDTPTTNSIERNPVVNLEGSVTYDVYGLYAGIASTLFKPDYTNYQRAGTWYVQGIYSPKIYDIPTTFAVSYNGAYQTQNFNGIANGDAINSITVQGPKREAIAYVQSEVWANVYLALEYAWLQTYNQGKGNAVTGDIMVYF